MTIEARMVMMIVTDGVPDDLDPRSYTGED